MPSKSKKQRRFMAAAANNPKFARKAGIKQSVAKEFHNSDKRKKYQGGGLARMAKTMYAQPPNVRRGMQPQGRAPMVNPAMRRPPPRGGLGTATKPQMSTGLQYDPRRSGPKLQPAGPSARMPPARGIPGNRPRFGGLSQYRGTGGVSGPARRPQQPGGGRTRFTGRIPGAQPGNGLLRTAGALSGNAGNRLNSLMGRTGPMRFAGGGKVKKALAALSEARDWLIHSSDEPEFDLALEELDKVGPEADILKTRVKTIQDLWRSVETEDEAAGFGMELEDMFEKFRQAMDDPDAPTFQERDAIMMDEFNTPSPYKGSPAGGTREEYVERAVREAQQRMSKGETRERAVDATATLFRLDLDELDPLVPKKPLTEAEKQAEFYKTSRGMMGGDVEMEANLPGGSLYHPRNFNEAIAHLQKMKDAGRRGTPEYNQALKAAQDLNPEPRTPVGFYLE